MVGCLFLSILMFLPANTKNLLQWTRKLGIAAAPIYSEDSIRAKGRKEKIFCDKMSEEGKGSHHSHHHHHHHHHEEEQQPPPPPPPQYGTFQGVANYPQPVIGFPQPVPPPGASEAPQEYYAHGYQAVPGYAVAEGTPVRQQRLPCCGCGIGWFLFIIGFFLAAIPWYVAAFILLCAKIDPREKPGYITCTVAAVLATIALILGLTKHHW